MVERFNEEEKDAIANAIWELNHFLARETERYYENVIFKPSFPGETPQEHYERIWGPETRACITALEKMLYGV